MKKIFILVLMVLVGVSLVFHNVKADEARTIKKNSYTTTTNTATGIAKVVKANGVTVYKISGYASSANAMFGLFDSSTSTGVGTTATGTSTDAKFEGGEATQYDSIYVDFGEDGMIFDTGLTVYSNGCAISIVYN